VKLAAFGLGLFFLALPFNVQADENLVAKRELCRQEAKARILPKAKIGVDGYRRIVERRNEHVSECMARVVVTRNDVRLPAKRALREVTQTSSNSVVRQVRKKKPHQVSERAERRKLKAASLRTIKGKRLKRLPRMNK
jgi:hypothetical protein